VTCFDNRPEGGGVFRIAIMQKIATVLKGAASLHGRVPGHLQHPLLVRVIGDPGNVNPAALEVDGRVEDGRGSLEPIGKHPVSHPRSSNAACRFPIGKHDG
jgi:hypothetical protein